MNHDIPSMFVIETPTQSLSSSDKSTGRGESLPVLVSADIITEHFCCDIEACQGRCCEEGNAGAPITMDELAYLEEHLDEMWPHMSATAQAIVDKQGVAYTDPEGDLVTSICNGKDCCFRGPKGCLMKERPISCFLYPIREKRIGDTLALNYDRWSICKPAIAKGRREGIRIYQFLREPLIRRFGETWYNELCAIAEQVNKVQ